MTDFSEGRFLHALFDALNQSGAEYAVLRNFSALPRSAGGSDVDIYVNPRNRELALRALNEAMSIVGADSLGEVVTDTFYEIFIIGLKGCESWGVCIEFYYGVFYKGSVPLVDPEAFKKVIVDHNGINVIDERVGNALGFIKEIMVHNSLRKDKPQYEQSLRSLLTNSEDDFLAILSPLGIQAPDLLRHICESADATIRKRLIRKFRYYVLLEMFLGSPLTFIRKRLRHELERLKRLALPPGTVVAVLGVDGSGKSTLIESFTPILKAATHNAVFYQHLRPNLLPPLAHLKGQKSEPVGPVIDPHASVPSGKVGSLVRLVYLLADYFLGYWLKIRLLISKRPAIVIFDRYSYDMHLDQRRFRVALPKSLLRLLVGLAPKPDLIVCLYGDPTVLAARKNELPVEEVARQVESLKAFAEKEPRAVLVNTEGTVEQARDEILEALVTQVKSKQSKNGRYCG